MRFNTALLRLGAVVLLGAAVAIVFPVLAEQDPKPSDQTQTTATGKDQSGRETEAIKEIAAKAIDSAKSDVDIVKWIFIVFAGIATVSTLYSYKSLSEVREAFRKKADEEVQVIAEVRRALIELVTVEHFLTPNLETLGKLSKEKRDLTKQKPSADRERKLQLNEQQIIDVVVRLVADLGQTPQWIAKLDPAAATRWRAWLEAWHGLVLHRASKYAEAITHFEEARKLSKTGSEIDNARFASHSYNLACSLAMLGEKNEEALAALKTALSLQPWRWPQSEDDPDFEELKKADPRFASLIELAKEWAQTAKFSGPSGEIFSPGATLGPSGEVLGG